MKKTLTCLMSLAAVVVILVALASPAAAATGTAANKTFDVYVSQSFAAPPYPPFLDCFTFTSNTLCSAACGDCGTFNESSLGNNLTIWKGTIPCNGLNLTFVGVSNDTNLAQSHTTTLGASGVGGVQGTSFGVEGFVDSACPLSSITGNGWRQLVSPSSTPAEKKTPVTKSN